MPVLKPSELVTNRVQAIKHFHTMTGIERAELDLSGGIDSAVMAGLLVLALGADKVTLAHLAINSNPEQTERAKRLAQGLGCRLAVSDFTVVYDLIVAKIKEDLADAGYNVYELDTNDFTTESVESRIAKDPTILGSIRSTLRAPLGRAFNRMTGGGIRHGTGNECEDRFLRFYQKGGDGEVDTNPIAMLSKAEVYQLAYELGNGRCFQYYAAPGMIKKAYTETIGAIPSADLWACGDAHTDESEIKKWLGADFTYGRLDPATGKVVSVGTIERVARFLDETNTSDLGNFTPVNNWDGMFGDDEPDWPSTTMRAIQGYAFEGSGLTVDQIMNLLKGARKAEAQTRHKENPNIPQLGTRQELLAAGILSDDFADYGIEK